MPNRIPPTLYEAALRSLEEAIKDSTLDDIHRTILKLIREGRVTSVPDLWAATYLGHSTIRQCLRTLKDLGYLNGQEIVNEADSVS